MDVDLQEQEPEMHWLTAADMGVRRLPEDVQARTLLVGQTWEVLSGGESPEQVLVASAHHSDRERVTGITEIGNS